MKERERIKELIDRLEEEELRMQRLFDYVEELRKKHYGKGSAADFNSIKHAISGRDPVLTSAASHLRNSLKITEPPPTALVEWHNARQAIFSCDGLPTREMWDRLANAEQKLMGEARDLLRGRKPAGWLVGKEIQITMIDG